MYTKTHCKATQRFPAGWFNKKHKSNLAQSLKRYFEQAKINEFGIYCQTQTGHDL